MVKRRKQLFQFPNQLSQLIYSVRRKLEFDSLEKLSQIDDEVLRKIIFPNKIHTHPKIYFQNIQKEMEKPCVMMLLWQEELKFTIGNLCFLNCLCTLKDIREF